MLSLEKGPGAKELAQMYDGDPTNRLELEDSEEFLRSAEFRIRYKLSDSQHEALVACILDDKCPEDKGIVKKFYDIREDLENRS